VITFIGTVNPSSPIKRLDTHPKPPRKSHASPPVQRSYPILSMADFHSSSTNYLKLQLPSFSTQTLPEDSPFSYAPEDWIFHMDPSSSFLSGKDCRMDNLIRSSCGQVHTSREHVFSCRHLSRRVSIMMLSRRGSIRCCFWERDVTRRLCSCRSGFARSKRMSGGKLFDHPAQSYVA